LRYDIGELVTDPAAYLFKIAANVASEWSMKASNRLPHDPAWLEDLTNDRQPDNDVEREFEHRRLAAALNALPARAREVLRLHFSEGLRHEEIAERLAVSARIVKRDLITSYSNLRDALGGASASSGTLAPRFRAFPERSS
jgi:RNA polymerase sigma-70 factor (ECF subfamily)